MSNIDTGALLLCGWRASATIMSRLVKRLIRIPTVLISHRQHNLRWKKLWRQTLSRSHNIPFTMANIPKFSFARLAEQGISTLAPSLISKNARNLINIVRSNSSPPLVLQLKWYSTSTLVRILIIDGVEDDLYIKITACVMNFITHEKAYSLYPRATFEERRSLKFLHGSAARDKAYTKYAERGWKMLDGIAGEDFHDLNSSLARGSRRVGDSKTWTIPILPKIGTSFPEGLTETNSWSLRYDHNLKPCLDFCLLISPQLQYCYLVLGQSLIDEIWKIPVLRKETRREGEEYVFPCLSLIFMLDFANAVPTDFMMNWSNPSLPHILTKLPKILYDMCLD